MLALALTAKDEVSASEALEGGRQGILLEGGNAHLAGRGFWL